MLGESSTRGQLIDFQGGEGEGMIMLVQEFYILICLMLKEFYFYENWDFTMYLKLARYSFAAKI